MGVIFMEGKMSKQKQAFKKRIVLCLMVLAALFIATVTVYAVLPNISLNSPTSFPVDI